MVDPVHPFKLSTHDQYSIPSYPSTTSAVDGLRTSRDLLFLGTVIAASIEEIAVAVAAAVFCPDGNDQVVGFSREPRALQRQEPLPGLEVLLDLIHVLEHRPTDRNLQGMRLRVHYPEVVIVEAYRVVQPAYLFIHHGLDTAEVF